MGRKPLMVPRKRQRGSGGAYEGTSTRHAHPTIADFSSRTLMHPPTTVFSLVQLDLDEGVSERFAFKSAMKPAIQPCSFKRTTFCFNKEFGTFSFGDVQADSLVAYISLLVG